MPKRNRTKLGALILVLVMVICTIPSGYQTAFASDMQLESAITDIDETTQETNGESESVNEIADNSQQTETIDSHWQIETADTKMTETEIEETETETESAVAEVAGETEIQSFDIAQQAADDEIMTLADTVTAPDVVGTIDTANEWQIVAEGYNSNEQANKQGYDIDNDGIEDIYYQKNVIPTGVENEFRVYMGITKRMSWDELLAESDFGVTTSHKYKTEGDLEKTIVGNDSLISPGKSTSGGNNYEAVVTFTRGGKVVHTYRGWYHGTTPNCSQGTGFISLKSLDTNLSASCGVNLQNGSGGTGGQLSYTINLDTMENKEIHFAVEDIVVDSVDDTMGAFITCEGIERCDGTNTYSDKSLNWNPISNGVSGVQVKENGGLTGYHYNIHQLVYKIHLNAEQDGFNSCAQNMNSGVNDKESYQTNQQAVLNCHMGTYTGSTKFQVPYVRGLLYDLEFQKVVKDSKISIAGIKFTVNRQQNGNTIAEQVAKSDEQITDENGWIKFHNLPWGTYTLQELAGSKETFQEDYLNGTEQKSDYEVKIGKVVNGDALSQDHASGHSVDWPTDINNMLFQYNGNGIFENTPNTAKITIKKIVNAYENISTDLKNQSYSMRVSSIGDKDIYLKPGASDTELTKLENAEKALKHEETITYDLIVPKDGGTISLEEIIPDTIKNKVVFESAEVTENTGSTAAGLVTPTNQGCEVQVLPGNDLTITITNTPVGTVKIQKVIDNYQNELANDAFIISAKSADDNGAEVNTEVVLKHQETSGVISIKKTTTLNINEVVPKEYAMSEITLSGGGSLNDSQVTVNPGEDVIVTVHNTYSGKPFFHASDAIKNMFKWK